MTDEQAKQIQEQIQEMRLEFQGSIKRVEDTIKPIADVYNTARNAGIFAKWAFGVMAVFLTILLGIIQIIKEFKK